MANKIKIKLQGKDIEGELINYTTVKEDWNEYQLDDGTKLKLKVVVSKVIRSDQINELGEPIYVVNSTNILDAIVPENLKIKKVDDKDVVQ